MVPLGTAEAEPTMFVSTRELSPGSLRGISGPLEGQVIPIVDAGFFIGRDRSMSQVIIDDMRVSKRHVWVGVRDGAVVAIDSGSTNGTYINELGTRVTEATLKPGDILIVSQDVARFEYQK